jgi:hypothetical protein
MWTAHEWRHPSTNEPMRLLIAEVKTIRPVVGFRIPGPPSVPPGPASAGVSTPTAGPAAAGTSGNHCAAHRLEWPLAPRAARSLGHGRPQPASSSSLPPPHYEGVSYRGVVTGETVREVSRRHAGSPQVTTPKDVVATCAPRLHAAAPASSRARGVVIGLDPREPSHALVRAGGQSADRLDALP